MWKWTVYLCFLSSVICAVKIASGDPMSTEHHPDSSHEHPYPPSNRNSFGLGDPMSTEHHPDSSHEHPYRPSNRNSYGLADPMSTEHHPDSSHEHPYRPSNRNSYGLADLMSTEHHPDSSHEHPYRPSNRNSYGLADPMSTEHHPDSSHEHPYRPSNKNSFGLADPMSTEHHPDSSHEHPYRPSNRNSFGLADPMSTEHHPDSSYEDPDLHSNRNYFGLGDPMLRENNSDSSFDDPDLPSNRNSSVQFFLYTPENPKYPCYIEPVPTIFDKCDFNSSYDTKMIIHGYEIKLSPGNLFQKMKDTILEYNNYNVIVVNWTKYNQQEYDLDVVNAYILGVDVADMIKFLIKHTGVSATSFHLIGHSLGAQIAGTAGKHTPNLGRITGLDPAGPGYSVKNRFNRLRSTDAKLVDAIHTSNAAHGRGWGIPYPMAQMNFYPNGGERQPKCQIGNKYLDGDGVEHTIRSSQDQPGCYHDSSITYFISSIHDCEYLSTRCKDYESYECGKCKAESQPVSRMGFHCVGIPGLQDHSKFYLNTSGNSPFC